MGKFICKLSSTKEVDEVKRRLLLARACNCIMQLMNKLRGAMHGNGNGNGVMVGCLMC